uniref:Reverse transcriptase domain, reverse transcriptase zinc-binding domain protein n=1 Tax=Tanacetum cinerariifolium TaxID=118510 RepID=A0A6L2P5Y3_TANCI|nr:reverse transcriptase domain, reverse transcriptase zinc-binding domain protein [Tanacetum cinerariifolium]
MHNYHLDRGPPRCAFKVDIQKAYDTVDWTFLQEVLLGFGFHVRLVGWIMKCVTTTSFFISINGSLHGYFKGKRARVIMEALDDFKQVYGLIPSLPKSTAYFCNVLNHVKLFILKILPFEEGNLPVKYLGVSLVSSRLIYHDYKELIEKVQVRVNNWKNKLLSTAGRLQLIQSVIGSLHVFWASVFVLPSRILLDIQQIMRGFLLSHGNLHKGHAKVAWDVICLLKTEGALGIRSSFLFIWFGTQSGREVQRLADQDNLRAWDNVDITNLSCSLCEAQADSHEHLFFECNFSKQVWQKVKGYVVIPNSSYSIDSIMNDIIPFAKRKTTKSIIAKLVVAATSYFIWQERNNRMFKKSKRSLNKVADCIINSVRLKLKLCRWKKSKDALDVAKLWNLGSEIRVACHSVS